MTNVANVLAGGKTMAELTSSALMNTMVNIRTWSTIIYNVKEISAVQGDGVKDDFDEIGKAVAYVAARGGTLWFPPGKYRIGRGANRTRDTGGIALIDVSNIKIKFDVDAVLWMDNLNPSTNLGDQCNGVFVKGDCDNLIFEDVRVEWSRMPADRSTGDGFYFWGGVDPEKCPRNIKIIRPTVRYAPQASVILQGCRDIYVEGVLMEDTHADGLHFNACHRNCFADGVIGYNVGDDCLAFVTYYDPQDPSNPYVYKNGRPPFNSPDFTTRNNNHSVARNIIVDGDNHASGVRISGGYDITVENVKSRNRKTGFIVDSAIADGSIIRWSYLASRRITIRNVSSYNDDVGFQVQYFNFGNTSGWENLDDFTLFDIDVQGVRAENSKKYGIYYERCRGVKLDQAWSNREIRLRNVRQHQFGKIESAGALINVIGNSDGYGYPIDTNTPDHDMTFEEVRIEGGAHLYMEKIGGVNFSKVRIKNSIGRSIIMVDSNRIKYDAVDIFNPNRSNASDFNKNTFNLVRCKHVLFGQAYIETDVNEFVAFDIGGGNASDVSDDILIMDGVIRTKRNSSSSGIVVQGGEFAARNVRGNVAYFNGGEPSPRWRVYETPQVASGPSSSRPTGFVSTGFLYFDTDLNKPIWYRGATFWIDASGTVV